MTWPRVAALAALVIAAVAVVFGANAVLRPGCSLLPVALSTEQFSAQPGTFEQACAVLGRPLPRSAILPRGAQLAGIQIDGPPPSGIDCCRMVHVSYAMNGRSFALMSVHRQDAIPSGNVGEINASLAGVPAVIKQTRRPTLDADDVSYL
jgi:hypothetical protein